MEKDFFSLGIHQDMEDTLKKLGITEPTPIQQEAIPLILKGSDVIGNAQTGTGKTLAFVLPIMENLRVEDEKVGALIVTPTRELAIQITKEIQKLLQAKPLKVLSAYGGQDVEKQLSKLKGKVHIVVGTPGRILDHLRRKSFHLGGLKTLVIDEADQMLEMGFLPDIEEILKQSAKSRQTLCFTATLPREIQKLAGRYMKYPRTVRIETKTVTVDTIKQLLIETTDRYKQEALIKMMEETNPFLGIIFCRTKRRVSILKEALQTRGFNCDELHGDLTQAKRERVMKSFREAKLQYLIATDIAARGLDINGVTHVYNYDIPEDADSYIHRIGRTGRAGSDGMAITFYASKDEKELFSIEKAIGFRIPKRRILSAKFLERERLDMEQAKTQPDKKKEYKKDSKDKKFGDKKFGDKKFGNKKFGDKKFSGKKFGDKKENKEETEPKFGRNKKRGRF